MSKRRVVVTGIGPLSSIGFGKDAVWNSIVKKKTNLTQENIFIDDTQWDRFWVHKIEDFNIDNFGIDEYALKDLKLWKKGKEDKDLLYLLAAIKLALDDSKICYDKENNNIGLFLTVEHPGFEPFCAELIEEAFLYLSKHSLDKNRFSKSKIFKYLYEKFVQNGYDLQTFMYLYLVAKVFGLHGYSLFTSNACASGLYALEAAARQIKYGGSEVALVAAGDYTCTMFKHLWFSERGLYAEDGKIKPFSKKADGIVMGDGASAIVLEDLGHALDRGAFIYAEYLGGGFSLEGWKVTVPQIGSNSYQMSMRVALEKSGLSSKNVDLINPHGVGIKVTDGYEAKAITDIFHSDKKKPLITALKPYIGHNLGGSAMIELIISFLAMQNNLIPSALNCDDIDPKYNIELVKNDTSCSISTLMKLACGFAGYNGATIFKKHG